MLDQNQLNEWFTVMQRETESYYLASKNPYQQSGWNGSAESWRIGREPILEAISHSGTFLDIGCANGLLLESLFYWASKRCIFLLPYGIDLSPRLIALARQRLPTFSSHFFIANAFTWSFPKRFDYVHTLLEYVPEALHCMYLDQLRFQALAPGGRLIVSSYSSQDLNLPSLNIADYLRKLGYEVQGEAASREVGGWIATHTAWMASL